MHRVLCSTGSLITRANGRNHRLLLGLAAQLDCDGFEFLIYEPWYAKLDEVTADIVSFGLTVPSVHCDKMIGELIANKDSKAFELFEINCRAAYALSAEKLVLHLWNGQISDSNFDVNMAAYPQLAEIAASYGLQLTVENVVCNCKSPLIHLTELMEKYPDIAFTFDTKMAEFHGEIIDCYDETLWSHICHLHINDYKGGIMDWSNLRTLHLGEGQINFDDFFAYVKKIGYTGDFTVEATSVQTDGTVDINKLNADFLKIKGYIA
ncbi:MAG: TIM barrel protein [Oscillospiraceae bacterium]|nr:TIM barrel protein [Oscillospiraceae bacterium]